MTLSVLRKSAVVAAALLAALPARAANVIANGDFETGGLAPWIASGNAQIVGALGGDFWFGGGSTAQDGHFAIAFNAGDRAPNGVLSQTFATVPGTPYSVQYDFGSTAGGAQQITATVLGADGSAVLGGQLAWRPNPPQPLNTFGFAFVADGGQATLRFADVAINPTISQDGILDNVSVLGALAIPEPEAYALLLAGLAPLGFAIARRKS